MSALLDSVAEVLIKELHAGFKGGRRVRLMLSGGRTPVRIVERISEAGIPLDRLDVSFTDERWVPSGHPDRTSDWIRARLGAAPNYVELAPFDLDGTDLVSAARSASAEIAKLCPFDIVLVGMGMDGHIASIFPRGLGMEAAFRGDDPVVGTVPAPLPPAAPWARISVTLPALAGSRSIHLVLASEEKRAALERFVDEGTSPIAQLVRACGPRLQIHGLRTPKVFWREQ